MTDPIADMLTRIRNAIAAKHSRVDIPGSKGISSISHLERVSRPGRRVYVGATEVPRVLGGYGVNIVSTSKGLMSGKRARQENVGGEILAQIY